jgi:hypothetical protein
MAIVRPSYQPCGGMWRFFRKLSSHPATRAFRLLWGGLPLFTNMPIANDCIILFIGSFDGKSILPLNLKRIVLQFKPSANMAFMAIMFQNAVDIFLKFCNHLQQASKSSLVRVSKTEGRLGYGEAS